jgi:hypothetical protein
VPQAVPHAEQDDQQAAQSVPCELLAVHSGASQDDPLVVHSALDELPVVHSAPCELLVVRSVASPRDPLGGQQADCLVVRLAGDHWSRAAVS